MSNFPEKKILRLTTSIDNKVWMLPGDEPPTCSDLNPDSFVTTFKSATPKYPKVRIMGSKENADLIVKLYQAKSNKEVSIASIELCTPLCCTTTEQRKNPSEALYAMRRWVNWPTSKGGWHEIETLDYLTYGIAHNLKNNNQTVTSSMVSTFRKYHPIWPYLAFVPTACAASCVALIGLVLDPRWFVDVAHPDRTSKLEAFLGLGNGRYPERMKVLEKAWQGNSRGKIDDLDNPRNFLARTCQTLDSERGIAKASKQFLMFVRNAWMDVSYPGRRERLFDPGLFFARKSEAEQFKHHMANFVRE